MKRTLLAAVLIAAMVLPSCKGSNKGGGNDDKSGAVVLDIYSALDKDSLRLEDVADVEYLLLDSKSKIEKSNPQWAPWIAMTSTDIFIKAMDNKKSSVNRLMHFTREGKYIATLDKMGKGKDEYQTMRDIAIDTIAKNIIIFDSFTMKFVYYDYGFNYVKTVQSEFKDIDRFVLFGDGTSAFCKTSPSCRSKSGIAYTLISLKDGKLLKEYPLYGKKGIVTFGTSSDKNPEKNLIKYGDVIYMSDLACYDSVYCFTQDSTIRPAYRKLSNTKEMQLKDRTYLYMLFDTDRYAQFVRYQSWADQFNYVYDKKEGKLHFSSLYSNDNKSRGKRTWWNSNTGMDNVVVRIEKVEDLRKYRKNGIYIGKAAEFIDNLIMSDVTTGWALLIMKFKK